ncbi:hypothetical protein PRUB_b0927 [Pseudoalteromonas rubra]|uniref:Calcineurin-like phosphoesterase domain-containing protein n=1 Tax=Pseudoalteromonas rubra TaxID=43658 RepID=A0A8T0C176_9GAMM|nr:metallophosphoesterase [Pseudoalteromonas rubra]KAF7781636.1 hypothetical protein PRUB_b0927 [Pseudoalteromonas rubra]
MLAKHLKLVNKILTPLFFTSILANVQAQEINFFAIADPQFGWSDSAGTRRAQNTMRDSAILASKCTNCIKAIPIAGDLTMDGDGRTTYGNAHKHMESFGVKVLDGLGNHDSHDLADDETSFDNYSELHSYEDLYNKGWKIFDEYHTNIDGGDCSGFNHNPKHYCTSADAYYYTAALAQPGTSSSNAAAYLIQLHNQIYSKNAVAYLKRAISKIGPDKPVIIVGHYPGGSYSGDFVSAVRGINLAAIIHGHYHCNQGGGGDHCDYKENSPGFVIDAFSGSIKNRHGSPVPVVNVNAAFHNIFWSISLDTSSNRISFKRYNRAHIGDAAAYSSGDFNTIVNQVTTHGDNNGYNQPYRSSAALTCSFGGDTRRCIDQIRGGTMIPSGYYAQRQPTDGYWGGWGNVVTCAANNYVYGYRMRSEPPQGSGDDTALNDVELYCAPRGSNSYYRIFSKYASWGNWSSNAFCSGGYNPVTGFRMRTEPPQGGGDDTAANDVQLYCQNGALISAGANSGWGDWSSRYSCPSGQAVTGIITRVEDSQGGDDDTALNGVRLICAPF